MSYLLTWAQVKEVVDSGGEVYFGDDIFGPWVVELEFDGDFYRRIGSAPWHKYDPDKESPYSATELDALIARRNDLQTALERIEKQIAEMQRAEETEAIAS